MNSDDDRFEALLDYLKGTRGFDFTAYKRSSLMRRIQKRLQAIGIESYDAYQAYLAAHPEEFGLLFNTILINVTSFFRDPEAWGYLTSQILPRILTGGRPDSAIRVWSTGCASGEEAYTLAMILAEHLGIEAFRRRVKIYASDVDEDALMQARHATYGATQVEDVPPELLSKYFERVDDRYLFHKDIRRSIIFGRHDLIQDAPISRVNLLVCRNTLMYFTRETQAKVLNRFHFALRNGGFLFMGRAELLLTHGELFTPVELKWRVFGKTLAQDVRDAVPPPEREEERPPMSNDDRLQVLSLETDPVARVVVRADGTLSFANGRARTLFCLTHQEVGKRLQDLDVVPAHRAPLADPGRIDAASRDRAQGHPLADRRRRVPLLRSRGGAADRRLRRDPRRAAHLQRRQPLSPPPGGARALQERAGDRLRGAPVLERGAGDDQRGAPVDQRGAGDDQRGAPVDQRGAPGAERGAARPERRADRDERLPREHHREPPRRRRRRRQRAAHLRL